MPSPEHLPTMIRTPDELLGLIRSRARRLRVRRRLIALASLAVAVTAVAITIGTFARPGSRDVVTHPGPAPTSTSSPTATTNGSSSTEGAVSPGFQPGSVTFASQTQGWVLGTAAQCTTRPCRSALIHTGDGGRTWRAVATPPGEWNPDSRPGITRVRFADSRNGFVFGPGLFATHDGGGTWHPVTLPDTSARAGVFGLETSGGFVYAVAGVPTTSAASPVKERLFRSKVGTDRWVSVANLDASIVAPQAASLAVHGTAGWLALQAENGDNLFLTTRDGSRWQAAPSPCPAQSGSMVVSVASTRDVVTACGVSGGLGSQRKVVMVSHDGGGTFTRSSDPPLGGVLVEVSTPTARSIVVAAVSGASFLYASFDDGRTWTTVSSLPSGGQAWNDLGFTDATHGVVIEGQPFPENSAPPPTRLWTTSDGGRHWRAVSFSTTTLASCTAHELSARGGWQGAGGSMAGTIHLTNTGSNDCTLSGRPRVELDGSGHSLGVQTHDGTFGAAAPPSPVVLAAHQPDSAGFPFVWSNWCAPVPRAVTVRLAFDSTGDIAVQPDGNGFSGAPRCDTPGAISELGVGFVTAAAHANSGSVPLPPG